MPFKGWELKENSVILYYPNLTHYLLSLDQQLTIFLGWMGN